jgi:hypothetical protein
MERSRNQAARSIYVVGWPCGEEIRQCVRWHSWLTPTPAPLERIDGRARMKAHEK